MNCEKQFQLCSEKCIPEGNEKGKQKLTKESLFINFVVSCTFGSKWFQNNNDIWELSQTIIAHVKNASDPFHCLKLAEILCNLAFVNSTSASPTSSSHSSLSAVTSLVTSFCSKKSLKVDNSKLLHILCTLSSLVRVPLIFSFLPLNLSSCFFIVESSTSSL
jgi:hypothetical protein